jgi:hypothetical protein
LRRRPSQTLLCVGRIVGLVGDIGILDGAEEFFERLRPRQVAIAIGGRPIVSSI